MRVHISFRSVRSLRRGALHYAPPRRRVLQCPVLRPHWPACCYQDSRLRSPPCCQTLSAKPEAGHQRPPTSGSSHQYCNLPVASRRDSTRQELSIGTPRQPIEEVVKMVGGPQQLLYLSCVRVP